MDILLHSYNLPELFKWFEDEKKCHLIDFYWKDIHGLFFSSVLITSTNKVMFSTKNECYFGSRSRTDPGIFILGYWLAFVVVYSVGFNLWGLRHHKEICLNGLNTSKPILCFCSYSSVSSAKHLNKKGGAPLRQLNVSMDITRCFLFWSISRNALCNSCYGTAFPWYWHHSRCKCKSSSVKAEGTFCGVKSADSLTNAMIRWSH